MVFDIENIQQLKEPAQWLADRPKHKIILLSGDLGAGKTTFTAAIAKALGVKEETNSPTFSIVNEYSFQDKNGQPKIIFHIDLYRLKSLEEALNMGIEEYLYSGERCIIEWPEIISDILPEEALRIKIETLDESKRKIRIFNS